MNNVFISFKNTDASGKLTDDSVIAQKLYAKLVENNIPTFFSNVTLKEFGESAYKDAIEKALDEATILIIIATKIDYINSRWIKYEWSSFHEDLLAGDKKDGIIIPLLSASIARNEKPLAFRNNETFLIEKDSLDSVVEFVKKNLSKQNNGSSFSYNKEVKNTKLDSTYAPSKYKEQQRLLTQAQNTRAADMPAINYVFDIFNGKEVNVLDLGCAYGYVTYNRFKDFKNAKVLGIDRNEKCIEMARVKNKDDNFTFEVFDLEDESFIFSMKEYMEEHNIPKFDLIIATLVIHHLKDPIRLLRNVRQLLKDDGYIIIRGSDDGTMVSYKDNDLIKKIVERTLLIPGISDRLNGRKIYHQLFTSGYKNIKMFNYVKEISGLDFDQRMEIFEERFAYRRNYLKNLLDKEPTNMDYKSQLEWMDYALNQLEELFGNESFWYQEVDFVGVARKK